MQIPSLILLSAIGLVTAANAYDHLYARDDSYHDVFAREVEEDLVLIPRSLAQGIADMLKRRDERAEIGLSKRAQKKCKCGSWGYPGQMCTSCYSTIPK